MLFLDIIHYLYLSAAYFYSLLCYISWSFSSILYGFSNSQNPQDCCPPTAFAILFPLEILCAAAAVPLDNARGGASPRPRRPCRWPSDPPAEPAEHPRRKIIIRARLLPDTDLHARKPRCSKVVNDVLQDRSGRLPSLSGARARRHRATHRPTARSRARAVFCRTMPRRDRLRRTGSVNVCGLRNSTRLPPSMPSPASAFELHAVDLLAAACAVALQRTETGVVARIVVLAAGVAQTDNEPLDRLRRFCGLFLPLISLKISNIDMVSLRKLNSSLYIINGHRGWHSL